MRMDGKDLYREYGCVPSEGTLGALLRYPRRKRVAYRDWAEADGIDPDLSSVEFEPRSLRLEMLMRAPTPAALAAARRRFLADLSAPGHRSFDIIPGMTHWLRLSAGATHEEAAPSGGGCLSAIGMDLVEDEHAILPDIPAGGMAPRGWLAVDGTDLADFGIGSDGSADDLLRFPALKPPFDDGRGPDLSTVKTRHREIRLSLWMMAGGVEEFLSDYRAFFHRITGTGTRELYIKAIGGVTRVYYTDCPSFTVEEWRPGRVAARFEITLVAPAVSWMDAGGDTRYLVVEDPGSGLLADESGNILVFNR